jgi:hypothetical protein
MDASLNNSGTNYSEVPKRSLGGWRAGANVKRDKKRSGLCPHVEDLSFGKKKGL